MFLSCKQLKKVHVSLIILAITNSYLSSLNSTTLGSVIDHFLDKFPRIPGYGSLVHVQMAITCVYASKVLNLQIFFRWVMLIQAKIQQESTPDSMPEHMSSRMRMAIGQCLPQWTWA